MGGGEVLEVLLLGPTEVLVSGTLVSLSPLQRNVVAILALAEGNIVSTDRLVDSLWGERCPAAARSRIQGLISALRRKIGPIIVTRHPGYLIEATAVDTDVRRLHDLVSHARDAENPREALASLRDALALWRGEPLDGVTAPGVDVDRARLAELRAALLEDTFEAELELGHHATLVAELTAEVSGHPLRERLAGQLMLALYRNNRQADALRVYQELRDRLAEEVGSDPCPDLRHLHATIIRGAPEHPPVPASGITTTNGAEITPDLKPAQLPPMVGHFTGRDEDLDALDRAFKGRGDEPLIMLVSGPGGLGKTALLVQWAHAVGTDFPDGQVFLDLHGDDPTRRLTGRSALGAALNALGVPRGEVPTGLDGRLALYRTVISGRRVLLVADDAATTEQILPLVPPTTASQLVVTSRRRLAALSANHLVQALALQPLSAEAGCDLLGRIVGRERLDDPAVTRILQWCGGYPLVIRLVGTKLATRPDQSLTSFGDELSEHTDELLAGDARSVWVALTSAYQSLSPAAAHLFGRLGRDPGSDQRILAPERFDDPPAGPVRRLFDELIATNLVAEAAPGHYHFHPLVHRFARECGAELVDRDVVDQWIGDRHTSM
jgi:DNA-binding SARP family transcriptional activator